MGLETHCFSWADGAVCKDVADYFYPISIIEKEKILDKCREIGINAIVSIASDVAVVTVNYVAAAMGLIANPNEYTEITTNKYKMRQALRKHHCPCPVFMQINKDDKLEFNNLKFPVIVKPTDRSGSRGVAKVYTLEELSHAVQRASSESFTGEVIVEEFVDGQEISVETISFKGEHHILQITDKVTTGEPYFVELEHHQPSALPNHIKEQVKKIVKESLNALHIQNGASHSEIKITPEGDIKIIEIGARMGGDFIGSDLVELSTGYDFLRGVVEVAFGIFNKPQLTSKKYSGVYFLSKETSNLKKYIDHWIDYKDIVRAEITDAELREIKESADRSGYFIYQSDSRLDFQ